MRRPPAVTTVDFETMPIQPRPEYPPVPVGVSIKRPSDKKPHYFAWGHLNGGNNCSKADAMRALKDVWRSDTLLFHHAQFEDRFPHLQSSSDELFIIDQDRLTCAGGTSGSSSPCSTSAAVMKAGSQAHMPSNSQLWAV